jgi:hypothetical protein
MAFSLAQYTSIAPSHLKKVCVRRTFRSLGMPERVVGKDHVQEARPYSYST